MSFPFERHYIVYIGVKIRMCLWCVSVMLDGLKKACALVVDVHGLAAVFAFAYHFRKPAHPALQLKPDWSNDPKCK